VLTMKGSRYRGKGGGFGVPPGRLRGRMGRKLPLSPNPREMTPSPHSPPPEGLPSLGDLFSQQARISVGIRLMGTRASSGPLPPSDLLPVYSDVEGMSVYTRCDRNNSLTQGFVGPTALVGHRGCCVRDDGAILIGHRGCGALIQGGTSLVSLASVHLVCVWC
jgi:hypothetical protein